VITPDLLPRALLQEVEEAAAADAGPADPHLAAAGDPRISADAGALPAEDLRSSQRVAVERVLAACDGNVSKAARRLGIHRSTIYRLLSAGTSGEASEGE
jgi:ActR/RegA family two-component response regulator